MTTNNEKAAGGVTPGPHTVLRRPDAKPGEPQVMVVPQGESAVMAAAAETPRGRLEHGAGGITTRDDPSDLGVPMKPADLSDPPRQGPEDALQPGQRGDYRGRT